MNYIKIKTQQDLSGIVHSDFLLTGDEKRIQEEIEKNCWAVALSKKMRETSTVQDLEQFVEHLIHARQQMLHCMGQERATFYLWLDEMVAHLCFNVISGCDGRLPFGCTLEYVESPASIIHSFLSSSYHDGISWKEVTIEENSSEDSQQDVDDLEKPFILPVYAVCMYSS